MTYHNHGKDVSLVHVLQSCVRLSSILSLFLYHSLRRCEVFFNLQLPVSARPANEALWSPILLFISKVLPHFPHLCFSVLVLAADWGCHEEFKHDFVSESIFEYFKVGQNDVVGIFILDDVTGVVGDSLPDNNSPPRSLDCREISSFKLRLEWFISCIRLHTEQLPAVQAAYLTILSSFQSRRLL